MIYVFIGSQINILKDKVNKLVSKLNISNIINYDFDEIDFIDILNELNYVDLFNEKKLVIVNNFSFKKLKSNEEELFIKYINNSNDNVLVLKCKDESLDNRKSLIKLLREKCNVEEIINMDYKSLHEYITKLFKENHVDVTYNQVKKILSLTDGNVDVTLNEVDKLLMYIEPSKILHDEDIDEVVSKSAEKEMFRLTDAVMSKNTGAMFDSYKILLSSGVDSTVILDYLAKQFRSLYQVKILINGSNEYEIAKKLSLNSFVVKKMIDNMNNFKEEEIISILYKLSDIDIDIKVNSLDKNKLLEMFFLNI